MRRGLVPAPMNTPDWAIPDDAATVPLLALTTVKVMRPGQAHPVTNANNTRITNTAPEAVGNSAKTTAPAAASEAKTPKPGDPIRSASHPADTRPRLL